MKLLLGALGVSTILLAGQALAADLVVDVPEAVMPASDSTSIYVQLLGGLAAGLDKNYYSAMDDHYTDPMDAGWAVAGTIGVVVMDGLSIEGDIFYTSRDYAEVGGGLTSLSGMINAKYTVDVSDGFALYGAVGVGYIMGNDTWNDSVDNDYSGFGYQLIVGAAMDVADNVAVVGEVRYQNGFGHLEDSHDGGYDNPNAAALVGLRLGF